MSRLVICIQARTNSTRLPGKIYEKIGNKTLLKHVYDAAVDSKRTLDDEKVYEFTDVVVAGPSNDERLKIYCIENLIPFIAPLDVPEDDLLSRYAKVLEETKADAIIRLTADCPFLHHRLITECARNLKMIDYVSNTKERSFMEGMDIQSAQKKAFKWINTHQKKNREHPFFDLEHDYNFEAKFTKAGFTAMNLMDLSNPVAIRTSVDDEASLLRARATYSKYMQKLGT